MGSTFLSPEREIYKEKEKQAMRVLQKILFTLAMVVGLSVVGFAQKDDQKKVPKQAPPVITPAPKPPPKKDDKKKSSSELILAAKESLAELA